MDSSQLNNFHQGDILVTAATNSNFVDAMRISAGIVTEESGVRSHAAQIGLRLSIPVIVGVKDATNVIRDGSFITLRVEQGLVYLGADGSENSEHGNLPVP